MRFFLLLIGVSLFCIPAFAQKHPYLWNHGLNPETDGLAVRIAVPHGYDRELPASGSWGYWLQHLPLKKGNPPVYLYNGQPKRNQDAHVAVVDMDIGRENLQQCADAVIRLRAEYLYASHEFSAIHFNFTSGFAADYLKWEKGYAPKVNGNSVRWVKIEGNDDSYQSFRKYLKVVFQYAGTASLSKEMMPVADVRHMKIGDVFIIGGFPGHAVIVVDLAVDQRTGKKVFLLAQSYLPAQEIEILKNPTDSSLSPWYRLDFGETLLTPEYTFHRTDLKRFG